MHPYHIARELGVVWGRGEAFNYLFESVSKNDLQMLSATARSLEEWPLSSPDGDSGPRGVLAEGDGDMDASLGEFMALKVPDEDPDGRFVDSTKHR